MRRLVVLLLLVVVQFQLAWGAAAPYCAHEANAPSVAHFGHHEHSHATPDPGDGFGKLPGTHADCQSCHLACLGVVAGPAEATFAQPDRVLAAVPQPWFNSFIPDGPERPDRRSLAAA